MSQETTAAPVYVPADGPENTAWVVVGEAPGSEEVKLGRGFVGPSGKILWPLVFQYAGLSREAFRVTNLCKHPLDDDAEEKLSPDEFAECCNELVGELEEQRRRAGEPLRILAVGAWAAKALLAERYTEMEAVNGMTYDHRLGSVTPTFHPASALRGAGDKDPLAWIADALAHYRRPRKAWTLFLWSMVVGFEGPWGSEWPVVAVDTEGTPDDPICMTFASKVKGALGEWQPVRVLVWPDQVARVFESFRAAGKLVVYHNAPWDWKVLEAMGVTQPWNLHYRDTMELAYLAQTEPQGLKALGYRWFHIRMPSFEEVVAPYWEARVRAKAAELIAAGTTVITHSEKTGKELKKPRVVIADDVKPVFRALGNLKLLAERTGEGPGTLRDVPLDRLVEYATLDAAVTFALFYRLSQDA